MSVGAHDVNAGIGRLDLVEMVAEQVDRGDVALVLDALEDLPRLVVHLAAESPFRYQFDTDDYPPGMHTMTAVGYKADGTPVYGAEFVRQFLSAGEAKSSTMKIIVPLLILVGIVTLVGALGPALMGRGKEFKPGNYGAAGGAVCPRCTFPYSRNIFFKEAYFFSIFHE